MSRAPEDIAVLNLAPEGGWLRRGQPWQPARPLYAVLGDPIDHSLSPVMQAAGLRERKISADYLPARIRGGELARLKQEPDRYGLQGFNVTSPLKEEAAALCDGRTDAAREAEAVNTVQVRDGLWLGHNTDSGGIGAVLSQAWPDSQPPAEATLLGAGGAARAALCAVLQWGVLHVKIMNRSAARRSRFEAWLARSGKESEGSLRLSPLTPDSRGHQTATGVWICCLPPALDIMPYLPAVVEPAPCLLLDLRYGAVLPSYDLPRGYHAVDGLPVLLMQGGLSFAWWFGLPVPWQAMRAALTTERAS
jgi:shikimate dehydrogenase